MSQNGAVTIDAGTRAALLSAFRRPPRRVASTLFDPGGEVYLSYLTSGQRDRFLASLWDGEGPTRKRNTIGGNARLISLVWVDERGESRGFTEAEVAEMDGEEVDRLADLAVEMNGLAPKSVETAKGNS